MREDDRAGVPRREVGPDALHRGPQRRGVGPGRETPRTAHDVGLEQIRSGLAWWYREYAREQGADDRHSYEAAEQEARVARRGLWRDAGPVPPWDWRRQGRGADRAEARGGRG